MRDFSELGYLTDEAGRVVNCLVHMQMERNGVVTCEVPLPDVEDDEEMIEIVHLLIKTAVEQLVAHYKDNLLGLRVTSDYLPVGTVLEVDLRDVGGEETFHA